MIAAPTTYFEMNSETFYKIPEINLSETHSATSDLELSLFDFEEEQQITSNQHKNKSSLTPIPDPFNKFEIGGSQSSYTKAESESSPSEDLGVKKMINKRKDSGISLFSSNSIRQISKNKQALNAMYRRRSATKKLRFVKKTKDLKHRKSTFPLECEIVYEKLEEKEMIEEDGDDQLLDFDCYSDVSSVMSEEEEEREGSYLQSAPKFDLEVLKNQINRSKETNSFAANACFSTFKTISRLSSNIAEKSKKKRRR